MSDWEDLLGDDEVAEVPQEQAADALDDLAADLDEFEFDDAELEAEMEDGNLASHGMYDDFLDEEEEDDKPKVAASGKKKGKKKLLAKIAEKERLEKEAAAKRAAAKGQVATTAPSATGRGAEYDMFNQGGNNNDAPVAIESTGPAMPVRIEDYPLRTERDFQHLAEVVGQAVGKCRNHTKILPFLRTLISVSTKELRSNDVNDITRHCTAIVTKKKKNEQKGKKKKKQALHVDKHVAGQFDAADFDDFI
ncbi:MAG: hypothetical protein MHM6MM_001882 [Cercozoa sp. M6MM]